MSKHWRPDDESSTAWLSPGAYARLSPGEKRALWGERQVQRHNRRFRPTPARYRKGYHARQRLQWLVACMVGVPLFVTVLLPRIEPSPTVPAEPTPEIEWGQVQAIPKRAPDAADVAWEQRAAQEGRPSTLRQSAGQASSARTAAVRASFGYCKWGGGTNCVVDGDTFYLNGDKVRIAGIDAPETHPPRCDYESRLGDAATERLHALLNSGAVTVTSIDRDRDVYGRMLRNVAVDGHDVGEAMVSVGVAREYGSGRRSWCG